MTKRSTFIGLDVHSESIAVAIVESGRFGEVGAVCGRCVRGSADISAGRRYLKRSTLALHTMIQRIDRQQHQSGEAQTWEQDLAEWTKNKEHGNKSDHKLIK